MALVIRELVGVQLHSVQRKARVKLWELRLNAIWRGSILVVVLWRRWEIVRRDSLISYDRCIRTWERAPESADVIQHNGHRNLCEVHRSGRGEMIEVW